MRLLEIIEDGDGDAFLDDPALIGDPEIAKDGNAILTDVYGTKTAALKEAKSLAPSLDKKALGALTAIAATSVVAALARSQRQSTMMPAMGVQQAAGCYRWRRIVRHDRLGGDRRRDQGRGARIYAEAAAPAQLSLSAPQAQHNENANAPHHAAFARQYLSRHSRFDS